MRGASTRPTAAAKSACPRRRVRTRCLLAPRTRASACGSCLRAHARAPRPTAHALGPVPTPARARAPGAAPLFLGERALEKLKGRATKPATYNLDLNLIGDYCERCWIALLGCSCLAALARVPCSGRVGCCTRALGGRLRRRARRRAVRAGGNPPRRTPRPPGGWFGKRSYHHTGMVSMWYAMREALAIVGDEGLQAMWARHVQARGSALLVLRRRARQAA